MAVVAGTGWLYLLRGVGPVAFGPDVAGALPLQQLAGDAAQPLAVLVLAWVPAGALAGAALARWTRLSRPARALAVSVVAAVMLFAAGAFSDAVAVSEPVVDELGPQAHRAGTWVAVALMALGSLLVRGRSPASGG